MKTVRKVTHKLIAVKCVLWFLLGIAGVAGAARFMSGLGATTALSDKTPWGFWIGFDVVSGVALAAGGFVIAGVVYIAHMEKYRPLARPAILTAFLGYAAVALALAFDVGLPWNLWRPLVHPQHHSALFEVAMCVMLYLTVLALEFSPVVFERLPFKGVYAFLKHITLPLVIAGIILSTLHQSSLGTLFVIMPSRVHPLWYSSLLPLLFFVSAVGLGLAMVTLESLVTTWLYDRESEVELLSGLARACACVLGFYAVLRIGDVAIHGKLHYLVDGSWEGALFIAEVLVSAVLPAVLFSIPAIRKSRNGLLLVAGTIVAGFVLNRLAVTWFSHITATGMRYFPSWPEFALTLGIVSGAALVFFFFVENFSVYPSPEEGENQPAKTPGFDAVSHDWSSPIALADYRQYSFMFILGAALAFAFLPDDAVRGAQPASCPVQRSRRTMAVKLLGDGGKTGGLALSDAKGACEVLLLDGNRNQRLVLFNHDAHVKREGDKKSCVLCHHMNMPEDRETPCGQCHRAMYTPRPIFDHDYHMQQLNGNKGCVKCHKDASALKNCETATPCAECHKDLRVAGSRVSVPTDRSQQYLAVGYMQAMHGLCVPCHKEHYPDTKGVPAVPARCTFCHDAMEKQTASTK